ncbi:uncharacterized protein LOC108154336 isoform X1 [Drosophila miranda]|uniref:uncharacterized protein LOC108154336 isoform X1 n=1 Tax=Drosophila miranda TaxID=7229 RepID=UPI0007E86CF7|nr:uncharacterized protein LOC108154336 isoform X1 [Drosophila miranda]
MSRLSSSTYSSICFLVFLHFVLLLLLTTTTTSGKPASGSQTTSKPTTTPTPTPSNGMLHVSSYVNQKRPAGPREEFDFEQNEAEATNSAHVRQLFGSLLLLPGAGNKSLEVTLETDDEPVSERNTLDELDPETASEQHEGATESADTWSRIKLAIPVLEPVKHLINAVGGGGVNDTHVRTNSHRLIGHHGVHHAPHSGGNISSPAIETEEDRETAIESTGFDVLETLGSAGTVLWGILQNLRKLFAASAGNASASSSGGGGN